MSKPIRSRRQRRGAAAVEFAFTFPLLLLMTFGIVEYGWMFHEYNQLHTALRDAARTGAKGNLTTPGVAETEALTRFDENAFFYDLCGATSVFSNSCTVDADALTSSPPNTLTLTVVMPYSPITGFPVPGVPGDLSAGIIFGLEP